MRPWSNSSSKRIACVTRLSAKLGAGAAPHCFASRRGYTRGTPPTSPRHRTCLSSAWSDPAARDDEERSHGAGAAWSPAPRTST